MPERNPPVSERCRGRMGVEAETANDLDVIGNVLRRFGLDSLGHFMASVISTVLGLASTYLFTRLFPPGAYGQYSLAVAIVAPMVVMVSEWAAQPVGRFYSEYRTSGKMMAYRRVTITLGKYVVGLSLGAASLLVWSAVGSWGWGLSLGAAANVFVDAVLSLVLPIILASFESSLYRRIQVVRAMLRLGIAIGLVHTLGTHPANLVWASVVAGLVVAPVILSSADLLTKPQPNGDWANSVCDCSRAFQTDTDHVRRFVRYGAPMTGWFLALQLLAAGDRYVIQIYLGSEAVGVYSANYNLIASAAGLLSAPVTFAAFPIIMRMWADGRRQETGLAVRDMTGWYFVLGLGIVFGTCLIARDLVSVLLGPEFRSGYPILPPVMVGMVLWNASLLGQKTLEVREATLVMVAVAGMAALANLMLNLLFVPRYGMVAAAYTTAIGYAIYALGIWQASRGTDVPWQIPWYMLARSLVAGAIACGVVAVWTRQVEHSTLARLVQKGAGFTVLYLLLSVVLLSGAQRRSSREGSTRTLVK